MELRNRNFSTAFCYHFSHVSHVIHIFSHVQNACFSHFSPSAFSKHIFFACSFTFFTIMWRNVKKEKTFWTCAWKQWKNAFWKCTWKNVKNAKKTFEHPVGKVELWFFGVEFCCSYFAACPSSAVWKSEGSSSNQSEVDCVDRRSVYIIYLIYSKAMTARSKNIKSNAEGKENKASNCLNKYIFSHVKNNACLKHSFFHMCFAF